MGLEHERIKDQVRGQLDGTLKQLEVAERMVAEAEAKRDRLAESVAELRLIVAVHEQAVA